MDSISDSSRKVGDTMKTTARMTEDYGCPYCARGISHSPGGVKFHVKSDHPDKYNEFMSNYYPKMDQLFKEKHPQ
jgi:hypothetical protein